MLVRVDRLMGGKGHRCPGFCSPRFLVMLEFDIEIYILLNLILCSLSARIIGVPKFEALLVPYANATHAR